MTAPINGTQQAWMDALLRMERHRKRSVAETARYAELGQYALQKLLELGVPMADIVENLREQDDED